MDNKILYSLIIVLFLLFSFSMYGLFNQVKWYETENERILNVSNEKILNMNAQYQRCWSLYDPTDYKPGALTNLFYNITYKTTAGEYFENDDIIILYSGRSNNTLLHEVGHRVYSTKLSLQDLSEWWIISVNTTGVVSEYAKTNDREDFAETFKAYYLNQNINDTARRDYIIVNKYKWESVIE